ncbi:MAG: hypothetical protein JJU29_06545 [Verrucomicrobia bacterium]|nr:hypothetical protein [Verrucomicrobiota bacterium]MCH8510323.1 hypothetical protein [Kiritimatiellia bacterium]
MGFLKQHVEKVLFLVLAVALGASILLALTLQSDFAGVESVRAGSGNVDIGLDFEKYDRVLNRLIEQPPSTELAMGVFTLPPRRRSINPDAPILIPIDAEFCPYTGYEQTETTNGTPCVGVVPDDVLRRLDLDPCDIASEFRVVDGTGFTVREQYLRGHDPSDPNDYPPHIEFLRVEEIQSRSVTFELRGIAQPAAGVYMLQLRWRYPDSERWESGFVRTGNTFGRNDEFTAVSFTENRVLEENRYVDRSYAVIRTGRHEVRLMREGDGRTGQISERSARLHLYTGPEWSESVRVDQTFDLDNKTYNVVDIHSDSVVIREEGSEETLTIRRATSRELEETEPPETETRRGDPSIIDDELGFDPLMIPF